MTLKNRITEYCRQRPFEWVHKGTIGRLAVLEWGYENENAGRRCRELCHPDWLLAQHPEWRITPCKGCARGILAHRENDKGQVEYRYNPIMQRIARKETTPTPSESREESKQIALQI